MLALPCSSTEPHMCQHVAEPSQGSRAEEGETNNLEKFKYKILLSSSEHQ